MLTNLLYEPFGAPRQWTWGNGTLAVRTSDQDGKVTHIDSAGLRTYAYDDAFRISGITDASDATLSWSYGYDLLDRLTSANKAGSTFGYSYDANGNRLTQSGTSASTYTIASTSNRLSSITGSLTRTYTYDAAGNTLTDGTRTLAYNNRGRMKSLNNGTIATNYTYNAQGQLIKKNNSTTLQYLYYDEAGHLLGEYFVNGGMIQETVWLGDIPVATLRPKTGGVDIFYVHTDQLNTPRKITRPSDNKLRWRWDPDAFGNGVPNESPQALGVFKYNLRFPGQIYLEESGLHYNYFRDYDAQVGRYVQSDPIGLRGGINSYAYSNANPITLRDPLGLTTSIVCRPITDWRVSWAGILHCAVFVWHWETYCDGKPYKVIEGQYSIAGLPTPLHAGQETFDRDRAAFYLPWGLVAQVWQVTVKPPLGQSQDQFDQGVQGIGDSYRLPAPYDAVNGPNSNTAAHDIIEQAGGTPPNIPFAPNYNWR